MSNLYEMLVLSPWYFNPAKLSEIAPDLFIRLENVIVFEAALETDPDFQADYNALLSDTGIFTPADEVAPEIEHTYAPVIQHVRFRKALEAGEPYAVNVARAVAQLELSRRNHIRITVAPFAHPIRAKL
jgi:hypothetical protein